MLDIPRDNDQFLSWAKKLSRDDLMDLEIELSRRITNVELQLADRSYVNHTATWHQKAVVMLKFDQWRLDTTRKLIRRQDSFDSKFVKAAEALLDQDTFGVLAARASGATNGKYA